MLTWRIAGCKREAGSCQEFQSMFTKAAASPQTIVKFSSIIAGSLRFTAPSRCTSRMLGFARLVEMHIPKCHTHELVSQPLATTSGSLRRRNLDSSSSSTALHKKTQRGWRERREKHHAQSAADLFDRLQDRSPQKLERCVYIRKR